MLPSAMPLQTQLLRGFLRFPSKKSILASWMKRVQVPNLLRESHTTPRYPGMHNTMRVAQISGLLALTVNLRKLYLIDDDSLLCLLRREFPLGYELAHRPARRGRLN